MAKQERRLEQLTGKVESQLVHRGTASEHQAIVLVTEQGERIVLQRIGGNAFDDSETRRLDGRRVEVEGYRIGDVLRFVRVKALTVDS